MTISAQLPPPSILWQPEKHLRSADRIWILTDLQAYDSRYLPWSKEQLFRVGILDLETDHVGLAHFGRDLARAMVRALVPPPPWLAPMPFGLLLHRRPHDKEEKGRYVARVELLTLEPELWSIVPAATKMFDRTAHSPNSAPGMWQDFVARAAQENAIEAAALRKTIPFSAGDIRTAIGDPDAEVTTVLKRLVEEGKPLPPTGRSGHALSRGPPLTLNEQAAAPPYRSFPIALRCRGHHERDHFRRRGSRRGRLHRARSRDVHLHRGGQLAPLARGNSGRRALPLRGGPGPQGGQAALRARRAARRMRIPRDLSGSDWFDRWPAWDTWSRARPAATCD
jgi:hypothetical protein